MLGGHDHDTLWKLSSPPSLSTLVKMILDTMGVSALEVRMRRTDGLITDSPGPAKCSAVAASAEIVIG